MGRVVRALALSALVAALVGIQGVPTASADDGDGPVGFTYGVSFTPFSGGAEPAGRVGCDFYKVGLGSGVLEKLNAPGTSLPCADGLTFDEDGTLFAYTGGVTTGPAASNAQLVEVDKHSGQQTFVGNLPAVALGAGGMTFDAEGHLWLYGLVNGDPQCDAASTDHSCLYEVDPDNGHSRLVGGADGVWVMGLAGDCEDVLAIAQPTLRGTGTGGPSILAEVKTGTGALVHQVSLPSVAFASGLDFDDEGHLWAIGDAAGAGFASARVYRIDPDDGGAQSKAITLGGAPFRGFLAGLAVSPISCEDTPEPAPAPAPVVVQPAFTG